MANAGYNIAKSSFLNGDVNVDSDTIKAILCMTNTTSDTEIDVDNVDALTLLDEMDGSGFTWGHGNTGRKTLATTIVTNDASDRAEVNIAALSTTWATLGAGTRSVQGVLIAKEGSANDTTAIPLVYLDFAAPVAANGQDFVVNWDAGAGDIFRIT